METVVNRFAQVLTDYSLALKPGDSLRIETEPKAEELTLAVYREAIKAGVHVYVNCKLPGQEEIFYTHANDVQLSYASPLSCFMAENFDAVLIVNAPANKKLLCTVDPARIRRNKQGSGKVAGILAERMAKKELRWCQTLYPTSTLATQAQMSFATYRDLVLKACRLDRLRPCQVWKEEEQEQARVADGLTGKDRVFLQGPNIDLQLSVRNRRFLFSNGRNNLPDGEIYTSPLEDSASGWVRFTYPAVYSGCEAEGVRLWFRDGQVIKAEAETGEEYLSALLETDPGARVLGELGIGTNYAIDRFTRNTLLDEKMGGTIHLAIGRGFPEAGGENESAIHWDMLCDMSEGEIIMDGEPVYRSGKFIR